MVDIIWSEICREMEDIVDSLCYCKLNIPSIVFSNFINTKFFNKYDRIKKD